MVDAETDKYIDAIYETLKNKTYHTSEYDIFERDDGKKVREIYKLPYYPDRIVHWAIMLVIEPLLIKHLTADTYSAIPDRGMHYGMKRVKQDLKDKEGCMYCLKLDIRKYYPSIDHDILKSQYRKLFKDKDLLWLIDEIIDSAETGVPIGNYLSQWSGNLYLSWFDHWMKEVRRVKYYHRYMDDIVVFGPSKAYLRELFRDMRHYLKDNLKLTIKHNWQIFPTFVRGVDFLGYRFFDGYVLTRKEICKRMKHKARRIVKKATITPSDMCSIASYYGWLVHCDGYRLTQKYIIPVKERYNENV